MIALDTSVVVRYLVGTPVEQAKRATRLIEGDADVAISLVAITEASHVLRSFYRLPASRIIEALVELMTRANVQPLEISKPEVIAALVRARAFESSPVTDVLIAASSLAHDAVPVYTFDKKFARLGAPVATP